MCKKNHSVHISFAAADVYEQTCDRIAGLGVETECVGGGRMKHEPGKKSIKVYGYSQVRK